MSRRILANIPSYFHLNTLHNSQEPLNNMEIDIEIDTPRDWSTNFNSNNSRVFLVYLNVSLTAYAEHVQALANNPSWTEKVEESDISILSYVFSKIEESNNANEVKVLEPVLKPYGMNVNNIYSQELEPFTIPYSINQSVYLQLWNGNFCSISIFSVNDYLEGDAKNIACSLYKMATFIRQIKIEDKTISDIPQIVEFSFVI